MARVRREVKLKTKSELVDGILAFWDRVDISKCLKYINHLKKLFQGVLKRGVQLLVISFMYILCKFKLHE